MNIPVTTIRYLMGWCAGLDGEEEVISWLDSLPAAPEPDWSEAPENAMFYTLDCGGLEEWWADKPHVYYALWVTERTVKPLKEGNRVDLPLGIDWRTTLRERPR